MPQLDKLYAEMSRQGDRIRWELRITGFVDSFTEPFLDSAIESKGVTLPVGRWESCQASAFMTGIVQQLMTNHLHCYTSAPYVWPAAVLQSMRMCYSQDDPIYCDLVCWRPVPVINDSHGTVPLALSRSQKFSISSLNAVQLTCMQDSNSLHTFIENSTCSMLR